MTAPNGGLTANVTFGKVKIDKTAPTIVIVAPANGNYALRVSVAASYTCSDPASGVATCVGTQTVGQAFDTGTTGAKTFTVTATDGVGLTTQRTVNYIVNNLPKTKGDCTSSTWSARTRSDASKFKNQGDCIQFVNTGK